jgi:RNA polymerase sigma-70 factor (ECF subfamily)
MIPTRANGAPAFAQYRPDPDGGHSPWGLHVLETDGDRITGINVFLDTAALYPAFGLPLHL